MDSSLKMKEALELEKSINKAIIIALSDKFLANHYQKIPAVFTSGEGCWIEINDKRVLDMTAQYSAAGFGRGYKKGNKLLDRVVGALLDELENGCSVMPGSCYNSNVVICARLIAMLTAMDKVVFMNSGAEAFDTAVKIVRKCAHKNRGIENGVILTSCNNFHGRTLGAISASTTEKYKESFGPLVPGFRYVDFGDINALASAMNEDVIAFITEPIQGEGGIVIPPEGYLSQAKKLCHNNDVIFVLDEIQTGLGRTGEMFGWIHDGPGAMPDMMLLGKMLGGGFFPISAVVGRRGVMSAFEPGDHGSTFGGSPLACKIASEVIKILQEEESTLIVDVSRKGKILIDGIRHITSKDKNKDLVEVRGRGLLIGLEFNQKDIAPLFRDILLENGLFCGLADQDHVLRISPPLIITRAQISQTLDMFEKSWQKLNLLTEEW